MKKFSFFICLMTVVVCNGHTQDFTSFGIITAEELKMKECSFDKEANAVVLLDEAMSNYNEEYNLITNRHIRIKVLKEKGIKYGDISIVFYRKDDFEAIHDIRGIVINTDENGKQSRKELERKLIYRKNLSERYGSVAFAFPDVKVGSIIEYTYVSTMKHYGGLKDWYFQSDIPVVQSFYHLYILPGYEFAYQVYKNQALPIDIKPEPQNGSMKFGMKNIPGLDDEPYMDSREDYIQRVVFQLSGHGGSGFNRQKYMTSWDELTREWLSRSDFGAQLNKDLPGTDDFIKTTKLNPSEFGKMKQVYRYVQNHLTWDGFTSIVSNDGVKAVWNRKKGNTGELNLILVNLLRAVGLQAHPMLVSERAHGRVNTQYPFIDQFNSVYAAVFIDDKKYYLNAADELSPPHMIPPNILNTTGFILNRKAGGHINITNESIQYHDNVNVMASVTADGNIQGRAFMNSSDYARVFRLNGYRRDKEKYVSEHFKKSNTTIDSFQVMNEDVDSLALQHKFNFVTPMNGSGDYKFIPINLFSGFETNPFISDKRFSDINFGFKRVITANLFVNIPAGFVVDALPKSIRLINPDQTVDFIREVQFDNSTRNLIVRMKINFKKSFYTAEEYPEVKEFYKKMFDLLNEQVVIKPK